MRIVVTGASGNVGRAVCVVLRERGHDVLGVDLRPTETEATVEIADCSNLDVMLPLVQGADSVCHLGEIPNASKHNRLYVYARNTAIGSTMMLAAAEAGVPSFVYASSCQVYGGWGDFIPLHFMPVTEDHPHILRNPYGASKGANEGFLQMMAARGRFESAVAVRMPHTYDPTTWVQRVPKSWTPEDAAMRGRGPVRQDYGTWLHSRDAGMLFALAAEKKPAGFRAVHGSASWLHTKEPIAERIATHHPDWPQLPAGWGFDQTIIDFRRTAELLDWSPVHSDAIRPVRA